MLEILNGHKGPKGHKVHKGHYVNLWPFVFNILILVLEFYSAEPDSIAFLCPEHLEFAIHTGPFERPLEAAECEIVIQIGHGDEAFEALAFDDPFALAGRMDLPDARVFFLLRLDSYGLIRG